MKKIRCVRDGSDFLELVPSDITNEEWFITMNSETGDVALDARAIRKLRKQLKRALIEIEGGSCEEKKAQDEEYQPGDRVYLAEGNNEGDDYCKSPTVYDINMRSPVKLVRGLGNGRWMVEYETCGKSINLGYAYEKSFGPRA